MDESRVFYDLRGFLVSLYEGGHLSSDEQVSLIAEAELREYAAQLVADEGFWVSLPEKVVPAETQLKFVGDTLMSSFMASGLMTRSNAESSVTEILESMKDGVGKMLIREILRELLAQCEVQELQPQDAVTD